MPQNYSLNGVYVSKEAYDKHHDIVAKVDEAKKKIEKVFSKPKSVVKEKKKQIKEVKKTLIFNKFK